MATSPPATRGVAVRPARDVADGVRPVVVGAAVLVLALIWAAALVLRGVRGSPGIPLDAAWAQLIAPAQKPPLTSIGQVFAGLGAGAGSFAVAVAVVGLLWWRRGIRAGLTFVVVALLSESNVNLMKAVDLRYRPHGALWGGIGSFPSGHTAYAAVIAVTLGMLFCRAAVWIGGFVFVVAMALSRTVVNAHWLTDTFAGAACGAALTVLAWTVALSVAPRFLRPGPRGRELLDDREA